MVTAVADRSSVNGIVSILYAAGTFTILPSLRTLPPSGRPSTMVLVVPGLSLPWRDLNASLRCVADGSSRFSIAARQSVGTTSNPTPGLDLFDAPTGKNRSDRAILRHARGESARVSVRAVDHPMTIDQRFKLRTGVSRVLITAGCLLLERSGILAALELGRRP